MDITVLGGGDGAYMMSADLTLKGHTVTMYEMPRFEKQITELLKTKEIRIRRGEKEDVAKLHMVTTNIEEALHNTEWIFISVPAVAHKPYAELLANRIAPEQKIILFPGTFGSLVFIKTMRDRGVRGKIVVAETDTLPWACRLTGVEGMKVYHTVTQLGIGVYPSHMTEEVVHTLKELYPLTTHPNVLECGLNSLNPVIHVASVLLNAGRIEYSRGEFYLYEEGITPSVAHVVEAVDEERRNISKAFGFNLVTLAEDLYLTGYGPKGTLWQAVKGSYLTPIKDPMSLQSRYLTEDTPYGLVVWSRLGDVVRVGTPVMDALITLVSKVTGHNYWIEGRTLEDLGIAGLSKEVLLKKVEGGPEYR